MNQPHFLNKLSNVKSDDGGKVEQLDEINPALATLNVGNERLMTSELQRDFSLSKPSLLAVLRNPFGKPHVPPRM